MPYAYAYYIALAGTMLQLMHALIKRFLQGLLRLLSYSLICGSTHAEVKRNFKRKWETSLKMEFKSSN